MQLFPPRGVDPAYFYHNMPIEDLVRIEQRLTRLYPRPVRNHRVWDALIYIRENIAGIRRIKQDDAAYVVRGVRVLAQQVGRFNVSSNRPLSEQIPRPMLRALKMIVNNGMQSNGERVQDSGSLCRALVKIGVPSKAILQAIHPRWEVLKKSRTPGDVLGRWLQSDDTVGDLRNEVYDELERIVPGYLQLPDDVAALIDSFPQGTSTEHIRRAVSNIRRDLDRATAEQYAKDLRTCIENLYRCDYFLAPEGWRWARIDDAEFLARWAVKTKACLVDALIRQMYDVADLAIGPQKQIVGVNAEGYVCGEYTCVDRNNRPDPDAYDMWTKHADRMHLGDNALAVADASLIKKWIAAADEVRDEFDVPLDEAEAMMEQVSGERRPRRKKRRRIRPTRGGISPWHPT